VSINLEIRPNPAAAPVPAAVIEIRYGQVGLVQVRVHTTDPGAILDELTGRVATAPHFFRRTGVCLDLSALASTPAIQEVQAVIEALRRAGMLAVGLSGEPESLASASSALNLPILTNFRGGARSVPVVQPVAADVAAHADSSATRNGNLSAAVGARPPGIDAQDEVESHPALIHTQPVRSGQRLYARARDLVITAGVGAGAEVMADGCVHVYGSLRGRAMAGAHGDLSARVFCHEFQAELVSIAGVFRVFETIPAELAGRPVQAWLAGESLHFSRLA